ncbi:ribose 5-phosphate isomerase B [Candidatus Woesearchaeota archaeon]|nr:ribose 5-phosphate isomerase B [Candidatus Woesearchaeota archaeon]
MVKISTSLFTIEKKELVKAVKAASNTNYFHIDVTDGEFVKDAKGGASLFYNESHIKIIKSNSTVPLDVHLMIANPLDNIERYAKFYPHYISFHIEAAQDPLAVIKKIKLHGVKPAIALNPDTPLSMVEDLLKSVDMVLLMSVVPGKGGQGYIPQVTGKIRQLRKMIDEQGLDTLIEVDGGIKLDNIYLPINACVDIVVSGTGIYAPSGHEPTDDYKDLTPKEVIEKMKDILALGSDHGGYKLKESLKKYFDKKGVSYKDFGCYNEESVDYPDYADKAVKEILRKEYNRGVLICGTGIGISIRANRYKGIRAAKCNSVFDAEMSRKHNDANILVLGGRTTSLPSAKKIFDKWYTTEFEGGRHQRRVDKLDGMVTY